MIKARGDRGRLLSQQLLRTVAALPGVLVVGLAVAVALGELCALLDLRPLASLWASRLFLVAVALVAAAATWPFRPRRPAALSVNRRSWVPTLPGLVLAGYALVTRSLPQGQRFEWFLGGDHVRHLIFAAELRDVGALSYAQQSYPRAWHVLMAMVWSTTGGRQDRAGLMSLVDVMSTGMWLLFALLSLATAQLAVDLAERLGLDPRRGAVAGLLAAALTLWPPFLSTYMAFGFENSIVAALLVAVAARVVVVGASSVWSVVVCAAAAVVAAHSWQLVLPAIAVGVVVTSWRLWRFGRFGRNTGMGIVAAIGAVAVVVALPGLVAVVRDIGLTHATDAGVDPPLPWLFLALGTVTAVWMGVRVRGRGTTAAMAIVLMPLITGACVALAVGIPVTQYYPNKLLWHTAVVGLAPLAVAAVVGVTRICSMEAVPAALVQGVAGAALVLGVSYAFLNPTSAFIGAWSTVDGRTVLAAITTPGADRAQVVWLGSKGDDTIARILLDYYRAGDTWERTPQPPLDVDAECALLHKAARPAVLSNRLPAEVQDRYSCMPHVSVVPAAG